MLNNATVNQLRDLRLPAMAAAFREQLDISGISSLSYEERVALIVEPEWLSRRNKRFERLIKRAAFRFPAVIEDIDYQGKQGITKPEVLRLSLGDYIKKAQNIIICGPTGVGKTYLACALGRAACSQGTQVLYTRLSDFFIKALQPQVNYRQRSFIEKCAAVPLLILDDWGLKIFTAEETYELANLFERRYGHAATIISGQVPSTAWHELFPDPTQADSILDRLIHNAYKYNISGESMRKTLGKHSLDS